MKRMLDVIGSLMGIAIMLLFFPLIALAIKLDSEGPVFVRLKRVSGGKVFHLLKFRTMIDGAEHMKTGLMPQNERADGPFFKIRRDPRVTRVGKVLRRFRIDEWPQFANVVKNEMSLVGPRPYEPAEAEAYPPEYRHLPQAKAGITGLSQISGSSTLPFRTTLELDERYLENRSLAMDCRIILKTLMIAIFDHTAV